MASSGSSWDIADFEKVADDIDKKDDEVSAKTPKEKESLKKLCRPYLISAGIERRHQIYVYNESTYVSIALH